VTFFVSDGSGVALGMPALPPPVLADRRRTRQLQVGSVGVGSEHPVSVQSMTTTLTADVNATLQQIAELTAAGCDIVRVACPSADDAEALPAIARKSKIPVIADIHFQPKYVFAAIDAGCAAVRVNPGNIKRFDDRVGEIAKAAKDAGTPIRIGVPASFAAFAISPTRSSKRLMLPGFTRTAAQPASIAANTYFGWKWMSAITGILDFLAIAGRASASSALGQATRTMSQPAAVSSAICCSVALTSAVSVVVMDCTDTGCSLPTPTEPTCSWRVLRRSASTGGGRAGIPSATPLPSDTKKVTSPGRHWPSLRGKPNRVDHIGGDGQRADADEHQHHRVGQREQPGVVHRGPGGQPTEFPEAVAHPLVDVDHDVTAVERQQRQQVEHPDEEVQGGE